MRGKVERIIPSDPYVISNADFFRIIQKMAQEKAVAVDMVVTRAVTSPKADRVIGRLTIGLVLLLAAYVGIQVLIKIVEIKPF